MQKLLLIFALTFLASGSMLAQRTVQGLITDDSGEALIGASVLVQGTSSGTVSDIDGTFELAVPANAENLIVSYTGFDTKTVPLTAASQYSIILNENAQQLGEVVVTALGIKRSEKAIGYAVQQVGGEDITKSNANSAVDALVGKASGIQITRSSGSVGAGSRITIRGVTSMIGNNQPLIVIDGVRSNNETLFSSGTTSGTAQANRLMDLNPDDIESINILKGAAATALYGTSGSTGVVLITTKKGSKNQGLQIGFSSSVGFEEVNQLPELQNTFAQGSVRSGEPRWRGPETGESGSWGPAIADLEFATDPDVYRELYAPLYDEDVFDRYFSRAFDSDGHYRFDNNGFLVPRGEGNGQAAVAYDNLEDVFQTGINYNNSLSLSGGTDIATFRLSLSSLNAEGVVPNEEYGRYTVKLASTLNPVEKLNLSASMNYTRSDFTRVQQGSNTSGLLLGLLRTPPTFDNSNGLGEDAVDGVPAYEFADRSQRNYRGGGGYDNPFWALNNTLRHEDVNRFFGNFRTNYAFTEWANLDLNVGVDITSDVRKQDFEIGSRTNASGTVLHDEFTTRQMDVVLNLTGGGKLTPDIGLNYVIGSNAFTFFNNNTFTQGDGFVFPGFIDLSNATNVTGGQEIDRFRQLGFIGQAEFSYRDYVYLTLSGRQDYDSRLSAPGRDFNDLGFFYPSAALSFTFSELMNLSSSPLSFGKLRASWARVGSPPPGAYQTTTPFEPNSIGDGWGDNINLPIDGNTGFNLDDELGNSELTPEFSNTVEVGIDLRFFNNRLGLDATYYQVKTTDAILPASVAPSTGYTNVFLNAGAMTSTGIELTLNATPVRTGDFEWNTQLNFTKNESIVDELAPGLDRLFIAGFQSAGTYLVAGNQYGAIFGGAYLREGAYGPNDDGLNIPEGEIVINDDPDQGEYGYQAVDETQRAIGNPNPDFILGWNNNITYKRFSLNWLLDWREGGDMWNGTAWALSFFGASPLTAETRVETPSPIPGVLSDGSPNNIDVVRDRSYWTSSVGGFGAVGEQFVQDGGWIRLREAGLTYTLPAGNIFKRGGSIGVAGRNLFLITDYEGVDPETSLNGTGNGQGFDYFNMPATRSVIFKLNVNF